MSVCTSWKLVTTATILPYPYTFEPKSRLALGADTRTLVLCVPAEQAFLAGSAIKAIGDFPITHVAYAWTLTVKAGEEL